jgi:hypothetical protein
METEGEDSYGFLRPEAILMIVILTDEVDCSYRHEHASIFSVDGNKVFWSDPEAEFPSSAVCWNAGVVCTGDPSDYECRSSNKDIEGNVDVHPSDAVLHPVSRYIEQVLDLEFDKKAINQTQEVLVSLVGGVGTDGTPHYAETIDPVFQEQFGIGAGCQSGGGAQTAIPPVRLAEFVAAFTEDNMHSVCEDDYGSAFGAIGNSFGTDPIPTCFVDCVLDSDPTTDLLEPLCSLEEHVPGEEESEAVDECARDENGWYIVEDGAYVQPAPDVNVCYAMRVDPDGSATADPNDDMSLEGGERYCFEVGLNLEFEIERRPGFYAAGGTSIEATCLISDAPESDCPEG